MITKIKNAKEKITLTVSAIKDFSWFFNTMKVSEMRTKRAFSVYTCIIFTIGVIWSETWDYCIQNEVVQKIIDFIKVAL